MNTIITQLSRGFAIDRAIGIVREMRFPYPLGSKLQGHFVNGFGLLGRSIGGKG
ncbi:MAG: hypothetical protein NT070_07165 [Cyanobacteria bacterium]|nr:hypothetical protein [Cyanobacteriota bacterium]